MLPPKSTILLIVDATELLICVMMNTPRKLKRALIQMALRIRIQWVVTQVAMALGASVQPLTKMTPRVSSTVISSTGLDVIPSTKDAKENSIKLLPTHTKRRECLQGKLKRCPFPI